MIIKNLDVIIFPQNHVFLSVVIIKFPKPSSFPHNLVHLPAAIIGLPKPSSFPHFLVFLPASIFKLPKPSSFPNNHTYLIGERNRRIANKSIEYLPILLKKSIVLHFRVFRQTLPEYLMHKNFATK